MSEREVLKHKNGEDEYEVTIGVDRVVIDHYCNGVHDDILSFDRIDCAWFAPILAEFSAPTSQPITADWLRDQGWEEDEDSEERSFWTIDLDTCFGVELSVVEGEDPLLYLCFGYPQGNIPLRPVTDTADLANLVAALRGGAKHGGH